MNLKCVGCGLLHAPKDRLEKKWVDHTMCPACGCGGFTKQKETEKNA